MQKVYNILVDDKPGVLDRVAGILRRYGWNISGLVASETEEAGRTLMTLTIRHREKNGFPQDRLLDLECVHAVTHCDPAHHGLYEVLIARGDREALNPYLEKAVKVDDIPNGVAAHWLGSPDTIETLHRAIGELAGVRQVRTGTVAIEI